MLKRELAVHEGVVGMIDALGVEICSHVFPQTNMINLPEESTTGVSEDTHTAQEPRKINVTNRLRFAAYAVMAHKK